jgi:hypothetical protein
MGARLPIGFELQVTHIEPRPALAIHTLG